MATPWPHTLMKIIWTLLEGLGYWIIAKGVDLAEFALNKKEGVKK